MSASPLVATLGLSKILGLRPFLLDFELLEEGGDCAKRSPFFVVDAR